MGDEGEADADVSTTIQITIPTTIDDTTETVRSATRTATIKTIDVKFATTLRTLDNVDLETDAGMSM